MLDARRISASSKIIVTWSKSMPEHAGQPLDAIAKKLGCTMEEAVEKLLPAGAIYFMMSEDDVRRVLSYPHTMIGSDGLPHDQHPHPRLWGTFPRVLGHYVRDVKLFPLEEAVRRMTALPAAQFGLKDRGTLQSRRLCRSGAVRSRDHRGHRDVRAAEDAGRGHRLRHGQRPRGLARRRGDRRAAGPRAAARRARTDGWKHAASLNLRSAWPGTCLRQCHRSPRYTWGDTR